MTEVQAGRMDEQVTDPVCGMTIEKDEAVGTAEYQGRTYYFCAPGCQTAFGKNPEKYAHAGHEHEHGGHH